LFITSLFASKRTQETGVDDQWRETLIREGLEDRARTANQGEGGGEEDGEMMQPDSHPGQVFRRNLMDKLFNSEFTQAHRRP